MSLKTIFKDNAEKSRYELHLENEKAFAYAAYRREEDRLFIDYVESPPHLRGTGVAGLLMRHIADQAKAENLEIEPLCGYAAAWLSRHNRKR